MSVTNLEKVFDNTPGLNTQAEKDFLKTRSVEDMKEAVQGSTDKLKQLIYRKYHVENFKKIDATKIAKIKSVLGDDYDKLVPSTLTKWASKGIAALQALAIHCVESMQLDQDTKAVADILKGQYITSNAVDGILGPNTLFLLKEISKTSLGGVPIEDWNGIVDDALYTKMIAICEGEKEEVVKEEVVDAQEVEKNEKKISLEINYYNTDGTLNKNVGPVRIDQIFDMSTSPDELQITHGTTTKTITKGTVKINGKDVNTYVYKDGKRVKIYEGDKIEEVKDEKKDQKLENLDNSEKSLYDQLQEKSALSCDILDHFDLNDDESILAILPFVKGGTFENFAQAMGAIEAFVHVPEADEHEDYLFDDFDPTTVALLKTLGLEDDVQLSDMMEVVNGANKLEKIANFGKIQKILLPYMEIPVTEKEPAGVDKKEELPTGTDNDYFIESVDDDNKKEEKTETIIEDKKEEEPSIELDNDSFIESTGGDKKEKVVVPVVEEKKELPTGTDNDLFIEPAIEIAPEVKNETDNQIVELAEEELKEKEINLTKLEPIKAKLLDIVKTAEPKLKQRAEIVMDKIEVSEIEEELKSEEINLQKLEPRKPKLLEIVARAEPELKQRAVVVLDKIELVEEENADIPKVDEIVPEVKNETIVESANETKENTTDLDKLYEIKKDQYLLLHVEPIKADLPALQRLVKDIDDNIKSENYKKEFADISNDLKRATEIYNQLQILNIAKEKASNYIDELEYNIDKEFYISELDKAGDNLSKLELFLADVNKKIDDIVGKQRKKGLLRTKEQKAKLQRSKEILQDIKIEAENRVKEQERLVGIIEEIDVDATFPDELLDGIATEEEKQVYWDKKAQLYGLTAATSDYLRESNPKKRAIRNIDDKLSEMGEPADPILKREKKSLESDKKKLEKELNKIKEPQEIKEQEKLLQELNSIKQKAENERRIKANEESSNK